MFFKPINYKRMKTKSLILSLLLAILSFATYAETKVTPVCWNNGLFTFSASDAVNGSATVTIIDAAGNTVTGTGAYSALITVFNNQVTFTAPQPIRATIIRIKVVWHDNHVNSKYSTNIQCNNLPVKLSALNVERTGDDILLSFTSEDEINVGYYKVSISADGINWQERLILFPKIDAGGRYTLTIAK
jgi:hypothetical protein